MSVCVFFRFSVASVTLFFSFCRCVCMLCAHNNRLDRTSRLSHSLNIHYYMADAHNVNVLMSTLSIVLLRFACTCVHVLSLYFVLRTSSAAWFCCCSLLFNLLNCSEKSDFKKNKNQTQTRNQFTVVGLVQNAFKT